MTSTAAHSPFDAGFSPGETPESGLEDPNSPQFPPSMPVLVRRWQASCMRRFLILFLSALILVGCSDSSNGNNEESEPQATRPPGSPEFARGRVLIDTGGNSVLINVDVAETDEQRAFGLMQRESMPDDEGMLFVFFEETTSAFTMRNTLIPLSIAFFDFDGEIVKILDMEPCEAEPCPSYDPGVTYRGALEVNQGAFDEWGVEIGDSVNPLPRSE